MGNVQIITDSMTDIPKEIVDKFNIIVVPLKIHFEEGEYRDGVDLTSAEFYEKLSQVKVLPKTSQIAPNTFVDVFKRVLEEGKEIICINGSSKASGTCQSAIMAKNEIESEDIDIIDTMSLSFGAGMLVYEAAKMSLEGLSRQEIVDKITSLVPLVDIIFTVDTLQYLKMGGRLKPMKATIAAILNIKPILTIEDGLVQSIDKVRGRKKVFGKMIEMAKERGGDFSQKIIGLAHAHSPENVEILKKRVMEELNPKEIIITEIGCTVGTHSGPGTLAIVYLK